MHSTSEVVLPFPRAPRSSSFKILLRKSEIPLLWGYGAYLKEKPLSTDFKYASGYASSPWILMSLWVLYCTVIWEEWMVWGKATVSPRKVKDVKEGSLLIERELFTTKLWVTFNWDKNGIFSRRRWLSTEWRESWLIFRMWVKPSPSIEYPRISLTESGSYSRLLRKCFLSRCP